MIKTNTDRALKNTISFCRLTYLKNHNKCMTLKWTENATKTAKKYSNKSIRLTSPIVVLILCFLCFFPVLKWVVCAFNLFFLSVEREKSNFRSSEGDVNTLPSPAPLKLSRIVHRNFILLFSLFFSTHTHFFLSDRSEEGVSPRPEKKFHWRPVRSLAGDGERREKSSNPGSANERGERERDFLFFWSGVLRLVVVFVLGERRWPRISL